ncbi:MAG: CpsD/CapB family tyrosine-protein kinase [Vicinamibacterales bacterium]
MTRIDEALKQAGSPAADHRGMVLVGDLGNRNDPYRLDEYPREHTAPAEGIEYPPYFEGVEARAVPPTAWEAAPSGFDADLSDRLTRSGDPARLEQYRRIAALMHESHARRRSKVVIVTSALPEEGRTTTAVNVALILAESYGHRVLLIDADLREGSHGIAGALGAAGLAEVLRGQLPRLPFLQSSPQLSLLPAGAADAGSLDALTSTRMRELLAHCAGQFDWVLLDTPPVSVLPHPRLLATIAKSVLFVVGAASTPLPAVDRAIADLGSESIIGTVLAGIGSGTQEDQATE